MTKSTLCDNLYTTFEILVGKLFRHPVSVAINCRAPGQVQGRAQHKSKSNLAVHNYCNSNLG